MSQLQSYPATADAQARARLSSEFPGVSLRIISAVLAAYQRVTPTVSDAVEAARARIMDARAV